MKNLIKTFLLLSFIGVLSACNMIGPDVDLMKQDSNQNEQSITELTEKTPTQALVWKGREFEEIIAAQVDARSGFAPIGTFSYADGSYPGSNVSVYFDGTNLTFYVIGHDGSMVYFRSNPYTIRAMQSSPNDTVGVEINLDAISSVKSITVDTVHAPPFAYSSANVLLSGLFDAKISNPSGSPYTGNSPAFVGMDDARHGSIVKGDGSYGKLVFSDNSKKVRIHHLVSGGNHYLVISSNSYTVPAQTQYCFANFKQYDWGLSFQYSHTSCK